MTSLHGKRVLVVGLGVSGIATAIRLRQIGWTPVVIERSAQRRRGGYFVGVFGSGRAAAHRLGVAKYLHDRRPTGVSYDYDRQGNRTLGMSFSDLPGDAWAALRGDVEDAAFRALPEDVELRFSTTPISVTQGNNMVTVTLKNTITGECTTEAYDLVVGGDGVRSTVRKLVFGPHEKFLHHLNHMIATCELSEKLSDLSEGDGAWVMEKGRSMVVYPFSDHAPTVLFSYRTEDVDAEFRAPAVDRLRAVFGPQPLGRLLTEVIDAFEEADRPIFASVEQVHMDSWSSGRVILMGDAAWCETLYSGLGVSSALAGPDLLGSMLERHPGDIRGALVEWEKTLRPYIEAYQRFGVHQRFFFTPDTHLELMLRKTAARLRRIPQLTPLFHRIVQGSKASQLKDKDIARAF